MRTYIGTRVKSTPDPKTVVTDMATTEGVERCRRLRVLRPLQVTLDTPKKMQTSSECLFSSKKKMNTPPVMATKSVQSRTTR